MGRRRAAVLVGVLTILTVGCAGNTRKAVEYSDKMVGFNKRLESASSDFFKALEAARQGFKTEEVAKVHQQYEALAKVVEQVRADFKATAIPSAAGAKEFRDAYDEFLKAQEQTVEKEDKEILAVLGDKGLDGPAKQKRIDDRIEQIRHGGEESFARLKEAQQAFAAKNNIHLVNK